MTNSGYEAVKNKYLPRMTGQATSPPPDQYDSTCNREHVPGADPIKDFAYYWRSESTNNT